MKFFSSFLLFIIIPLTLFAQDLEESPSLDSYYKEAIQVVHVKVLDAESESRVGGYENWRIYAEVIEVFKGDYQVGKKADYLEPTESGLKKERFLGERIVFLKITNPQAKKQIYTTIENSTVPATEHVVKKMKEIRQKAEKKKTLSRKIE